MNIFMASLWLATFVVGAPETKMVNGFEITRITMTDGASSKPRLHANENFLVVGQSATQDLQIFETKSLKRVLRLSGIGKILDVQITPSGWVAACVEAGSTALVFSIHQTEMIRRISFEDFPEEPYGYMGCTSVRVLESKTEPTLLITNPTNRSLFELSLEGKVLKIFSPFRGSWSAQYLDGKIFSLVNAGEPLETMPVVLDYQTGETLLGDGMGNPVDEKNRITTGYYLNVFPDQVSESVFYIQPTEQRILRLDMADPRVESFDAKIPISVQYATAIDRLGSCLLALGTERTFDPDREPVIWSKLKSQADGSFVEVSVSPVLRHPWTTGAMRQVVTSEGTLFVGGWNGVTRVKSADLLEGCR